MRETKVRSSGPRYIYAPCTDPACFCLSLTIGPEPVPSTCRGHSALEARSGSGYEWGRGEQAGTLYEWGSIPSHYPVPGKYSFNVSLNIALTILVTGPLLTMFIIPEHSDVLYNVGGGRGEGRRSGGMSPCRSLCTQVSTPCLSQSTCAYCSL